MIGCSPSSSPSWCWNSAPQPGDDLTALQKLIPGLLICILSFTGIGIYWNNHHQLLRATRRISGGVMWANLHLLFWLSLVPVGTAWVGAHPLSQWPAVIYGAISFLAGIAYLLLTLFIRTANPDSGINARLGWDTKAQVSLGLYALGIAIALDFDKPLLAYGAYALVAIIWFIPDRRFAVSGDRKA